MLFLSFFVLLNRLFFFVPCIFAFVLKGCSALALRRFFFFVSGAGVFAGGLFFLFFGSVCSRLVVRFLIVPWAFWLVVVRFCFLQFSVGLVRASVSFRFLCVFLAFWFCLVFVCGSGTACYVLRCSPQ